MYSDIGKKIKTVAEIFCIIGIVCSIIIGIIFGTAISSISSAIDSNQNVSSSSGTMTSVLIILFGSLISWISSFCLYGFGELIERVVSIDEKLSNKITKIDTFSKNNEIQIKTKSQYDDIVFCYKCGADITNDTTNCHVCDTIICK